MPSGPTTSSSSSSTAGRLMAPGISSPKTAAATARPSSRAGSSCATRGATSIAAQHATWSAFSAEAQRHDPVALDPPLYPREPCRGHPLVHLGQGPRLHLEPIVSARVLGRQRLLDHDDIPD